MNYEDNQQEFDKDNKDSPRGKDNWDKASILLKSVGGIITAFVIIIVGHWTTSSLEMQKSNENNIRLYTQIMSEREKSEQVLRSTMFTQIFEKILRSPDSHSTDELRTIKMHLVGIDMISRNFHEFLDMKPLFLYIMYEIVNARIKTKNEQGEVCSSSDGTGTGWANSERCHMFNSLRVELNQIAGRVKDKQRNLLYENGQIIPFEIDLAKVYLEENIRTEGTTPIPEQFSQGICINEERSLDPGDSGRKVNFEICSKRAFPDWNMVQVAVNWSIVGDDAFGQKKKSWNQNKEFWVSDFDFPMIDNTHMSSDEKYAVVLNKIDHEKKKAKIELIYFPASDGGLQEKLYYNQKVFNKLVEEGELFQSRKE